MEPLSAASSLLTIVELSLRATSALVKYASDTQNASAERKLLADEANTLSGRLERLREKSIGSGEDDQWLERRVDLTRQFSGAYDELAKAMKIDASTGKIKSESRAKAVWTLTKWSFTKSEVYALLDRVTRMQTYANTLLLEEQHEMVERIDQRQKNDEDEKQRALVLGWLTPLQMSRTHEAISKRAGTGSGRWFLTSSKFREWQLGPGALLWCPGIPGAGKTVIASLAVDFLRQKRSTTQLLAKEIGIAVIYLKYNDPQQTVEYVLGSVIVQLAQDLIPLPTILQDLYDGYGPNMTAPIAELVKALGIVADLYQESYVVIDALDECSDETRWELLEGLRTLTPSTHLLITSRFLDSISEELEDFGQLEIKANKADIELYIDHHIKRNKNLRKIVESSSVLREDIKTTVVQVAEDMFLLARLHVESLGRALSVKLVRKKLRSLPTTLDGTYDEALQRIEALECEHREIALKTLAWVSYAFRPLSLEELQHALAVEPDSTHLDEEDIIDGNSITDLCAGLVIVDSGTNVVTLVHYTTKKYFENIRSSKFPGFHATITMSCATYLALTALKDASIWKIVRQYPLACYAAQYMGDHARHNPEDALDSSVLEVIYKLLSHPDKRKPLLSLLDSLDLIKSGFYSNDTKEATIDDGESLSGATTSEVGSGSDDPKGLERQKSEERRSLSTTSIASDETLRYSIDPEENITVAARMPEVTALHLAASMGLARVASLLIQESGNVDAVDDTGKTALALAIEKGFAKAVEFLIQSGAKVDLATEHGQGIFLMMAEKDWHVAAGIIGQQEMLGPENGAGLPSPSSRLLFSAYGGKCDEISELLQGQDLDLRSQDKSVGSTALFVAIERQHTSAVRTLMNAGVDVNTKDNVGQFALHRATHRGHKEIIQLLLENGAEVDAQNDDGRTPWSANLRNGDHRILKYLLDRGADPNVKGHQGVSELYIAAQNGETPTVKLMLESGTDPSIRTQFDWAPLHWAAYYGHLDCVKLLMQAGADLNPVSDQDASPLDLAIRAGQTTIADLLIRAGAKESRDIGPDATAGRKETVAKLQTSATQRNKNSSSALTKVSLTFDKPIQQGMNVGQFIYPSTSMDPEGWIYQLSDPLGISSSFLHIRIAKTRADMVEYPLSPDLFDSSTSLYQIRRITRDYQQLELYGGTQSAYLGTISMLKDWTGGWKARHVHDEGSDYLFRTTPDWSKMKEEGCRWMTEDGTLLARTGMEDVTPVLTFEHGVQKGMQDVVVSCWVGKLWSEAASLQGRENKTSTQSHPSFAA